MNKIFLTVTILMLVANVFGTILRVSGDGTQDYVLIQTAIAQSLDGDTVLVLKGWGNSFATITSNYDYEIFLPGANVTYTLSDIEEPLQYGRHGTYKDLCINSINSYKLNGQMVKKENAYGPIYITK